MPSREAAAVTNLIRRLWWRAMWRLSQVRLLHGIPTAVSLEAGDPRRCFDRLDEALDLLERYDPRTLDSIREHFAGIIAFGREPFRVAYWNNTARLCVVTVRYLESPGASPEGVASTLVHENMHATLRGLGTPYADGRRAPIEVICAMAELAFARRIPSNPKLAELAERRIDEWATSGESVWSDEATRRAKLQYLRDVGMPGWFVTLLDRLGRVLSRRAA